jgi:hypothetical protein
MKKITVLLLLISSLLSCRTDLEYEVRGYTHKIIVEGYIASGAFAKVYLSLNIPLSEQVDSITIVNNVIRTAKVTISDGERTEVLTSGFWDRTHYPPHVYKGFDIKGEEGKTYYLTVHYSGYTVTSQTTIPYKTNISEFSSAPVAGKENLRILSMTLDIDPTKKSAFRVYTKKKKDKFFIETPFVYNSELSLSGKNTFDIRPKPSEKDSSFNEGSYFVHGDTVQVRLCAIDSVSTQFFKALTLFSSTMGVGTNSFIGEKDSLKSNISSPGFGIWSGSANTNYTVVIE